MDQSVAFKNVNYHIAGKAILHNISLSIRKNEFVVFLGESGCGKTTCLRLINALIFPSSGEVLFQDKATTLWDPISLRQQMGYVIQNTGLFPHWNVEHNIALVPTLLHWEKEKIKSRVRELCELIGLPLEKFGKRFPHELSGGQRQRVGVARALAAKPPVLLMDEAFGALDLITKVELQDEILVLKKQLGLSIVFVTHDIHEALKLADRIILMKEGRIVGESSPQDFVNHPTEYSQPYLNCLDQLGGTRSHA